MAIEIREQHGKAIRDYMGGWFEYGKKYQRCKTLSMNKALKEQIARGFRKKQEIELDYNLPYIKSNVNPNYIWPKQYKLKPLTNLGGIYDKFPLIGVMGYTGIVLPKKINGK